jgi:hypothetical protein
MKQTIMLLMLLTATSANAQKQNCDPSKEKNYKCLTKQNAIGGYGEIIGKDGAVTLAQVEKQMKEQSLAEKKDVLIKGKVSEVCQKKGCWMTVNDGSSKDVRIRFQDYAFFVPMNISKWTVYVKGTAYFDTTSVAMLKHYAEDAKKTQSEIDAITQPLLELCFTAKGVLFEKKSK